MLMNRKMKSLVLTVFGIGILLFPVLAVNAQTPDPQAEYARLFEEIETLKAAGGEISAELYEQYFAVEQQLFPSEPDRSRDDQLDEGSNTCPGLRIVQPAVGQPFNFRDTGQTYTRTNNCSNCRGGRDVFYQLELDRPAWLEISTCGSMFDTYLCVYQGSCCGTGATALFSNDNNPTLCGTNSLKAALSVCFVEAGTYYIVLDGYNIAASGHYALTIRDLPANPCGPIVIPECPADYLRHAEGNDEDVCVSATMAGCGQGWCGAVDMLGDRDVYRFVLEIPSIVTLSAYANDTPGRSGYTRGLNPRLNLFAGPSCDHAIYANDNFNGTAPNPVGNDSRIVTRCLSPGVYWAELAGGATSGRYELTIECTPCGE